jgi:polyhydroxyalkanoate synthase subunit PhaC
VTDAEHPFGQSGHAAHSAPDAVAERTEGMAAAAAFGVDRRALADAWAAVLDEAGTHPRAVVDAAWGLLQDLTDIALGRSQLAPDPQDARFSDAAWRDHPGFRRLAQGYLAWARSLDVWLGASRLEGIQRERARFVLDAAKDVLAPVNSLVTNPQALRTMVESRGGSLWRGLGNFIDDVRHNHGYPSVADRRAFRVGRDVAASAGSVIYRTPLFELIQYQPTTAQVSAVPLLYVFSQVNRFYLADLTPDRSLFQRLLEAAVPVFAISWKNPTEAERHWNLATYVAGVIEAVGVVSTVSGAPRAHLAGVCAGGIVAAAAAAVLAARRDDSIDALSLFVNVLDFRSEDSDFGLFVSERSVAAQKALVRARGVFTERNVFEMFALLRLEDNVMSFFRDNYLLGRAPLKHPLLFWSRDYNRVPAEFQCDLLDLSLDNGLAAGQLILNGERVDLSAIRHPVYLMAGSTDHITPWRACYRSTRLFRGDVTFVLTNQNHTQTISSRLDNRHLQHWIFGELADDADRALQRSEVRSGAWTHHWIRWHTTRHPATVPAPDSLGSAEHPPLYPAPGRYVVDGAV